MNVLVLLEDCVRDRYVVKPIVEAMFKALGRPTARVRVCEKPRLMGVSQALDWAMVRDILESYRNSVDLFMLCVDRDGMPGREVALRRLEALAHEEGCHLLGENAWQELEVWALAGVENLPPEWSWREVRAERDPKELYFKPYAISRGLGSRLAGGRQVLGQEAAGNYRRIRSRCQEVADLEERIAAWLP